MKAIRCDLEDVLVLEPAIFSDQRGFFYESYNRRALADAAGITADFLQDNHSHSARHVLRGLHYQIEEAQGKLVRATAGEIFDVAVDIRRSSPTFGRWAATVLSGANRRMVWIPPGFAHGYLVVSDYADVQYKTTTYWAPRHERCILWNDPDLRIAWPLAGEPILSPKDRAGSPLKQAEVFR